MFIEKLTDEQIKEIARTIYNGIEEEVYNVKKWDDEFEIIVSVSNWGKDILKMTDFEAVLLRSGYITKNEGKKESKILRNCLYGIFGEKYKNKYIEKKKQEKLKEIEKIKKSINKIEREF